MTVARVAYMITPFTDAGADRQLLELLKRIDRSRFEPSVYLSEPSGHIVDELHQLGLPVVDVGEWGSNERAILFLLGQLRRQRPDIIHSWMFVANTWARVAGRLAGVHTIVTSDRSMDTDLSFPYRMVDVALSPLSSAVVVPARTLAEHVHHGRLVPWRKIVTIYNGVDLDKYGATIDPVEARRALDLPLDRPVIGMVASFRPRKRWDIWLQAVAELARTRTFTAISCGDGPPRAEVERYAQSLGLSDTVRFHGVRSDIPRVMAALDVLTLSSDDEGTPNVVLQAMAASRPAVATDAGGTAEVIVDGETGFVVPRGNPHLLAARIGELLDSPARARAFGRAGRKRVEKYFTFEASVGHTMELYDTLLQRNSQPAAAAMLT